MSTATTFTIAELVRSGAILAIQDGNHGGSHPKATEYVPDGIPFIMASDVRGGRIDLEGCKRLPKERTDRLRIGFSRPGDVLLTHKGTVGEVAKVPEVPHYLMLTPQVTYYRVDPRKLDPTFLAFAFRDPAFQDQLGSVSAQSTRPYVAISTQRHLRVRWHPLDTQLRIAGILGAYDDLIEVNRRRVAVLEAMARGLFEEWFIRFRFPGHEAVPLIDTPNGPLPEGWTWGTLGELASYINRGIPPRYDPGVSTVVIGQKCIRNGRLDLSLARPQSKPVPLEKVVREGDVLINSTGVGTLGRVAQATSVPPGTTVDSHVTLVRARRPEDAPFIGQLALRAQPIFEGLGAGSTGQTELSRGSVASLEVAVPPQPLRERFGELSKANSDLAWQLLEANQRLAASRDLLLPRLISGELSIDAAERQLEAAE